MGVCETAWGGMETEPGSSVTASGYFNSIIFSKDFSIKHLSKKNHAQNTWKVTKVKTSSK